MTYYDFNNLAGNAITISLIKRALTNNSFKKFTIMSGTHGTGKSTCAGIAAMSLTCESPTGGVPCGTCLHCQLNKEAIESVGQSPYIKIINIAAKDEFGDIKELIKDVFVLQSGEQKQVYIFEEAHAMSKIRGGFKAFLAEVDRMPKNVYVIMCTTAISEIDKELVSRAIIFNFNRLNETDSKLLIKNHLKKLGVRLQDEVIEIIVKSSKGIPREIEKLVEFIIDCEMSLEEIRSFLQEISTGTIILLFKTLKEDNLANASEQIEYLLRDVSIPKIINALKDFFIAVMFLLDAKIRDSFTDGEIVEVESIFSKMSIMKCSQILENLSYKSSDADLKLALIKMHTILQKRTEKTIVTQKQSAGAKDQILVNRALQESKEVVNQNTPKLHKLTKMEVFNEN